MGLFGKSKNELRLEAENANLQNEINRLKDLLTPEILDVQQRRDHITFLISEDKRLTDRLNSILQQCDSLEARLIEIKDEIDDKQHLLGAINDDLSYTDFGLYHPAYNFANSEQYKDRLAVVRQTQKDYIKKEIAVSFPTTFTFNGSLSQGKTLVKENVKQILRSFNNECEVLIDKVKFNNVEAIRKKIISSFESLNKLNNRMGISINNPYLSLKLDELNLAYEYAVKKQQEKELAKEERERLKEEAKLQKEIEEARRSVEKEKNHYDNALKVLLSQLHEDPENTILIAKKEELESHLIEIEKSLQDIDYRAANKRAGYVYIISNIGSFGEGVYKIGMTRRLEPLDRISELGDASVPFNFDVHAMIFTDDAPALENALHKAFDDRKVNMVNQRREFFRVTLDEIEAVVKKNYDKSVEFIKTPEADQFRETQMILRENNHN